MSDDVWRILLFLAYLRFQTCRKICIQESEIGKFIYKEVLQTSILISGGDNKSVNYYNDVVQRIENWCKQSYKIVFTSVFTIMKIEEL